MTPGKDARDRARECLAAQNHRRSYKLAVMSGEHDYSGAVSIDDALRAMLAFATTEASLSDGDGEVFQDKVQPWLMECFGPMIAGDREERNHRFLEEALELVQACGCTASEAHQLVDYVFGRPIGELHQEIGGVMVTLAALCLANDADMHAAGWVELNRVWSKVDAIRAKQAAKPKHSPLAAAQPTPDTMLRSALERWRNNLAITRNDPIRGEYLHGPALDFVIESIDSLLAQPKGEGK